MTTRLEEINTWLTSCISSVQGVEPIQADASTRKYYRAMADGYSYVVMDSQPDASLINFVHLAKILGNRCNVPKIIAQDLELGLLLLTDFGKKTYLQALQNATFERANTLYIEALRTLNDLQAIQTPLASMDANYIQEKLKVFQEWYLCKHSKIKVDSKVTDIVDELAVIFNKHFSEYHQVFVHLDFHSRNLMVTKEKNPGILDFQDAMLGPITYDLVSLFQDAYIVWPRKRVEEWIMQFANIAGIDFGPKLIKNFDIVGLQRHLKNLGVFARLHHRDRKSGYLQHIPTLLSYINQTCERYPELSKLQNFLHNNIMEFTREAD